MNRSALQLVSKVLPLERRRAEDTQRALEKLLNDTRAGKVKGLLWVAELENGEHEQGASGKYLIDLESGARALCELLDVIHKIQRPAEK